MYTVEFVRVYAKRYHINRRLRGRFKKQFESIEDVVEFVAKYYNNKRHPRLMITSISGFSNKDQKVFRSKIIAISQQHK